MTTSSQPSTQPDSSETSSRASHLTSITAITQSVNDSDVDVGGHAMALNGRNESLEMSSESSAAPRIIAPLFRRSATRSPSQMAQRQGPGSRPNSRNVVRRQPTGQAASTTMSLPNVAISNQVASSTGAQAARIADVPMESSPVTILSVSASPGNPAVSQPLGQANLAAGTRGSILPTALISNGSLSIGHAAQHAIADQPGVSAGQPAPNLSCGSMRSWEVVPTV